MRFTRQRTIRPPLKAHSLCKTRRLIPLNRFGFSVCGSARLYHPIRAHATTEVSHPTQYSQSSMIRSSVRFRQAAVSGGEMGRLQLSDDDVFFGIKRLSSDNQNRSVCVLVLSMESLLSMIMSALARLVASET